MGLKDKLFTKVSWLKKKEETKEWENWSGSLKFTPNKILEPRSEEEISNIVRKAAKEGEVVRVAGAGHSSTSLVKTKHNLLSLNNLKGIESYDKDKHEAVVLPGMTIGEIGEELLKLELSMHNTGDVDMQNLSGAIGTGTHGTGKDLGNLSTMLLGVRMVNGNGDLVEYHQETDPEIMDVLRVSMGSCGIFTALRVQLEPAYKLHRKEYCCHIDDCLENLDLLINENRNFDFYWYPRSDKAKLRTHNLPGHGMQEIAFAKCVKEKQGWINLILPTTRDLKFDEMEYALSLEAGPECFKEIRKRIKAKHRQYVGWRVLYRTVKGDETYLSPFYKRDSVTIAILQNAGLEYWSYFKDIEPIFRAHGGRPHWGKKHTLLADDLRSLYPMWDKFHEIRNQMDPQNIFINKYLQKLLKP
jgi:FAD/FMN-containing dehydrogenase